MNEVREIVTKAIVAKGKKAIHLKHQVRTNEKPYSILGCWIINREFKSSLKDSSALIDGSFEVNIWYSKNDNTMNDVIRERVSYTKDIKIKKIVENPLKNTDDILVRILKHPTVTDAKINDDCISLDIDIEALAEVIEETKVQIAVYNQVTVDEEIEDFDIEVNDDFLSFK